jgi:hypothetical protein
VFLEQREQALGVGDDPRRKGLPFGVGIATLHLEEVEPLLDVDGEDVLQVGVS